MTHPNTCTTYQHKPLQSSTIRKARIPAQVMVIKPGNNAALKHAITYCLYLKGDSDDPPKRDTYLQKYTAN